MEKTEARKGPWTEEEDIQLVFYVNLFGDRRWDFIAKVSGLKRSGKSCRLRWVNYLHPGLKRGKMTPHEETLVLELHSKLGNRWSRIAQKLPGRTDNEIKNFWRTRMRKKNGDKQKKKAAISPPSSTSNNTPTVEFPPVTETKDRSFFDTGGLDLVGLDRENKSGIEIDHESSTMDEIWKNMEFSEESYSLSTKEMASPVPIWDFSPIIDSLWSLDEEESKMLKQPVTMVDHEYFHSFPFNINNNYYI